MTALLGNMTTPSLQTWSEDMSSNGNSTATSAVPNTISYPETWSSDLSITTQVVLVSNSDPGVSALVEVALVSMFGSVVFLADVLICVTAVFAVHVVRKVLNSLVVLLAVVDMSAIVSFLPLYLYGTFTRKWDLPHGLCVFTAAAFYGGAGLSLATRALIAANRLTLSYSERKFGLWCTKVRALLYCIAYTVAVLIVVLLPLILGQPDVAFTEKDRLCTVYRKEEDNKTTILAFNIVLLFGVYFFLGSFVCVAYTLIYVNIRRVKAQSVPTCSIETTDGQTTRNQRDLREGKLSLITAYLILAFCWLPYVVLTLYDPDHAFLPTLIHKLSFYALLSSYALNPIIFACRMADFKDAFRGIVHRRQNKPSFDTMYQADFCDLAQEFHERIGSRETWAANICCDTQITASVSSSPVINTDIVQTTENKCVKPTAQKY